MMINFKIVHLLLSFQLLIKISDAVNERQIGLGSALNPEHLIGAIKLASVSKGLSKVAGVPNAVMDTTFKAIENYSPISIQQAGDDKVEPTLSLDDKKLKIHLPQERVDNLVKSTGLDSHNIDWKLFRCPLSFHQLRAICTNKQSSSPGLSIMPMKTYIPKIMSSLERMSDTNFQHMEKYIVSEMDTEDFDELVEKLNPVEEGLITLPVSIKAGALQNRPGDIVLLCLGKFPPDKKLSEPSAIIPTILVGTIKHTSPVQLKPEPVTSVPTSTSNTMNVSPSEPEETNPSILEVEESPIAEAGVPVLVSDSETLDIPGLAQVDTITSSQSSSASSAQFQAKFQSQPQPQFQPQPFSGPQIVSHLPPPRQGRPGRPPPPPNFQPRPQLPPFDGRQPFPQQPRPMPRPRPEVQG